METALKELMDQASCRLKEIEGLHEERVHILQQLSNLQVTSMYNKSLCIYCFYYYKISFSLMLTLLANGQSKLNNVAYMDLMQNIKDCHIYAGNTFGGRKMQSKDNLTMLMSNHSSEIAPSGTTIQPIFTGSVHMVHVKRLQSLSGNKVESGLSEMIFLSKKQH
ncbi:E3 ubiquitin-protein ligase BRE1-like 1 isoform X2 [Humulus lupulus]|uniref:E3 ubiquitin-protein ligase BRE1-like 1 isoform X2 n=2 Tax=Humulus lupulus TaxID=3486 RepID=UPI002B404EF6|nr:E3 ubiquitin-protein ligase BRE1-like 1 isoform X2 [Humulus lupulus]